MEKIDFFNLFLMSDEIPGCPICGSRTEILLDLSHTRDSTQVHICNSLECKMEFVLVGDTELL